MYWETLLASTVVAAIVAAAINIVKTLLDNKAKTNDSVRLFRYTKLYEILVNWQKKNLSVDRDCNMNEIERNQAVQQYYTLAKPLVEREYWNNIDDIFSHTLKLKIELIDTIAANNENLISEINLHLIKENGRVEELFVTAIHKQMAELLQKK